MWRYEDRIPKEISLNWCSKNDFGLDLDGITKILDDKTKMIFIASPNNPTGNIVEKEELIYLLKQNIIVVVDECHLWFVVADTCVVITSTRSFFHPRLLPIRRQHRLFPEGL